MMIENTPRKKYEALSQGLAITSLVVGIVTLLVSFIPCVGVFAFIFGIIAILISIIGLIIAVKYDHPKGLIIGAFITSILGCIIAFTQYTAMVSIGENIGDTIEEKVEEIREEIEEHNQIQ